MTGRRVVVGSFLAAIVVVAAGCERQQTGAPVGTNPYAPVFGPNGGGAGNPSSPPTASAPTPPSSTAPALMTVDIPGAPMATPVDWSPACSDDNACYFARCNKQAGRCTFPCKTTEGDCKSGSTCNPQGTCVPAASKP